MTTNTVFAIAGPFSNVAGERLEPATEFVLVEKAKRTPVIIPAGNIVTEIAIKRRGDEGDVADDLTPGRGISCGVDGNARLFLGTPGVITDDLNAFDMTPSNDLYPYSYYAKVDPSTDINKFLISNTRDKTLVLQSAFGGNVISGGVSVVVKYKPFSDSTVDRFSNQFLA